MLGATGEDFSLARAPHMKTDYCYPCMNFAVVYQVLANICNRHSRKGTAHLTQDP